MSSSLKEEARKFVLLAKSPGSHEQRWIIRYGPKSARCEMFRCFFQARDRVVRSQFACTYKEEELPLSRVLDFPSFSQVSTCVHPTPKTKTAHDDRFSSNLKDGATGANLNPTVDHKANVVCVCFQRFDNYFHFNSRVFVYQSDTGAKYGTAGVRQP